MSSRGGGSLGKMVTRCSIPGITGSWKPVPFHAYFQVCIFNKYYQFVNPLIQLFPCLSDCPDHLSKPTGTKRKLPAERKSVPTKRRKKNSNSDIPGNVNDLPEDWEGVNIVGHVLFNDPWALFDPQNCKVPPSWYWIQSKDEIWRYFSTPLLSHVREYI